MALHRKWWTSTGYFFSHSLYYNSSLSISIFLYIFYSSPGTIVSQLGAGGAVVIERTVIKPRNADSRLIADESYLLSLIFFLSFILHTLPATPLLLLFIGRVLIALCCWGYPVFLIFNFILFLYTWYPWRWKWNLFLDPEGWGAISTVCPLAILPTSCHCLLSCVVILPFSLVFQWKFAILLGSYKYPFLWKGTEYMCIWNTNHLLLNKQYSQRSKLECSHVYMFEMNKEFFSPVQPEIKYSINIKSMILFKV